MFLLRYVSFEMVFTIGIYGIVSSGKASGFTTCPDESANFKENKHEWSHGATGTGFNPTKDRAPTDPMTYLKENKKVNSL